MDAYTAGFYTGALAFFLVLAAIFWFVGRWGWFGVVIRVVLVGVAIVRILSLLAHPASA